MVKTRLWHVITSQFLWNVTSFNSYMGNCLVTTFQTGCSKQGRSWKWSIYRSSTQRPSAIFRDSPKDESQDIDHRKPHVLNDPFLCRSSSTARRNVFPSVMPIPETMHGTSKTCFAKQESELCNLSFISSVGTGVTFAPKRGSHSPLNQKGSHSPLNNNNLNMLLNPLGFNLGTRGLLGGLGFRGGHGGICWLVSLFHMLLNPLGFNLGTRGHLGGLGFGGDMGAYVDLSLYSICYSTL